MPFLKVDKGLASEADGVQLMKPMPELAALLTRARQKGIFGIKMRSVINAANVSGIAAIVAQQFEVGKQILAAGLMPILEPEVNIKSADKAQSETLLKAALLKGLDALEGEQKIMLKLSIPTVPGLRLHCVECVSPCCTGMPVAGRLNTAVCNDDCFPLTMLENVGKYIKK